MHAMPAKLGMLCAVLVLITGCATPRHAPNDQVLRVGVCADYPPIVFKTNGVISGVEADLAALLGRELNRKIEFVELPFDELIDHLEDGNIDIVMSGMTDSDYRRDKVRFVEPYANIGQMALVRTVDVPRFATPKHIYHVLRVGVLKGTTGEAFARANVSNSTVSAYGDPAEALAALKAHEIDAYIDDAPFVLQAVKDNQGLSALQWLLTD
jgi:polar amino acid transport system substrate-binding protein